MYQYKITDKMADFQLFLPTNCLLKLNSSVEAFALRIEAVAPDFFIGTTSVKPDPTAGRGTPNFLF